MRLLFTRIFDVNSLLFRPALALFLFSASTCLRGDVLACWDPELLHADRGGWPSPWFPTGVGKNIKIREGLSRGPGLRAGNLNKAWGSNVDFSSRSRDEAERAGQFFTFEVEPAPGHTLELNAIDLNVRLTDITLTRGIWYQWEYRIGTDSFLPIGAPLELSKTTYSGDTGDTLGLRLPVVDLTGVSALRRVEGPVTLRLISWSDRVSRYYINIGRLEGDDLVLHGVAKNDP